MATLRLERLRRHLRARALGIVVLALLPTSWLWRPGLFEPPEEPWIPGRPYVNVESAEVAFVDEAVSGVFDLTLTLRNVGGLTAGRVAVRVRPSEAASPAQGSGMASAGDLHRDQTTTVTLRMIRDKLDASGRVLLTVELEYIDSESRRYTDEQTIRLQLAPRGWNQPQLMITGYATDPDHPAPGETFALSLQIANVGAGDARRLLLRLGGEQGLEPFVPLTASNVRFIPEVVSNASEEVPFSLLVDGAADGGTYPIEIALTYENVLGEAWSEDETIGLVVVARPSLQIDLFEPLEGPLVVGEPFEIPVEVINIGRQRVEVSTVELASDDLAITSGSLYLGPLDPGTSGTLIAEAVAERAGFANVTVFVHYQDDLNRIEKVGKELTFEVEPGVQPSEDGLQAEDVGEQGFLQKLGRLLLGFIGLGE